MGVSPPNAGRVRRARLLLVALAALAGAPAFARVTEPVPGAPAAARPMALARLRFGGGDQRTRMVLEVDHAVSGRVLAGEGGPMRLVLALSDLDGAAPSSGGGQGLIKAWALRPDGVGARLILDLAAPGVVTHRFMLGPKAPGGPFRFVIDVARAVEADPLPPLSPPAGAARDASPVDASFADAGPPSARRRHATAALRDTAAPGRRLAQAPPSRRAKRVVVIDAGHGGHDPGAQSAGADEKDITLAAARALAERLARSGRYKVVLTRDTDVFIPLEERVRVARRAGADLFVSLHADSAGADPGTHGASVYTLSDHGESRVTQVLGPHEWFSGAARRAADPGVGQILLDLTQRSTLDRSALFAGILVDHVRAEADLLPRSHRDAGYFVLLAPDVPAVLLEMGFISSPGDQARLTDPLRRGRLMDAVAAAIDAYFLGEPKSASRS